MENLDILVKELCTYHDETQWLEFKRNNCEPHMIGEDISALANSAVLADRGFAYMLWGVDDKTHNIIGTTVRLKKEKKGNQELENWLRYLLSDNADFEFLNTDINGKHVEILRISKAVSRPVNFEKIDYIRSRSYTKKLMEFPSLQTQLWDRLRQEHFEDKTWSTYLHACLKYIEGDALTNTSLRERFGLKVSPSAQISRLIKDTVIKGHIRPLDPSTAPRYMRYIPSWG